MSKRWWTVAALLMAAQLAAAESPASARAQARELLQSIIAFKTEAGRGQVPVMAEYLAGRFHAGGFPAEDVHIVPVEDTAALVVRYRGSGQGGRPILLLAHMDVVTAKPEDWQRDPFHLVEENGYFYGRGTYDDKGEVALLTATFLRLKAENFIPTRDLILVFSGDEETTFASTAAVLAKHRDLLGNAEFALNSDGGGGTLDDATGRPLYYQVQGAEKSVMSYELTVHNPGGHSSEPRADNAIYELADALKKVQVYRFPVMWNDWTIGGFKAAAASTPGTLGAAMAKFAANPGDAEAAAILEEGPTMIGRTRTTCIATMLHGGHADNALPQSATATINCRIFPGVSADEVLATLQQVVGKSVEVRKAREWFASPASPLRKDVMDAVTSAILGSYPGVAIVPDQAPYATDGVLYREAGIPTYGVSSAFLKDADSFSHGLNERLPIASFHAGLDYWQALLKNLAGRH